MPLPADVRVTQKGFNIYVWMEHLKAAVHRMAELGCRKLVWSDGRARVLPVEGATAGFKEQVLQFLYMLCGVAANFDMTVLIEPLGPRRTNRDSLHSDYFPGPFRVIGEKPGPWALTGAILVFATVTARSVLTAVQFKREPAAGG